MQQWCRVCGEAAAGFHFGAFTCEGCKSFFGRSYNSVTSLSECKSGGRCVITKKNRTTCKSCRLRQCIKAGMSKSGSRYGRRSNWFKIHCLLQDQPPSSDTFTPIATKLNANSHAKNTRNEIGHDAHEEPVLTITKKEIKRESNVELESPTSLEKVRQSDVEIASNPKMEESVTITRKIVGNDNPASQSPELSIISPSTSSNSRCNKFDIFNSASKNHWPLFVPSDSNFPNASLSLQFLAQAASYQNFHSSTSLLPEFLEKIHPSTSTASEFKLKTPIIMDCRNQQSDNQVTDTQLSPMETFHRIFGSGSACRAKEELHTAMETYLGYLESSTRNKFFGIRSSKRECDFEMPLSLNKRTEFQTYTQKSYTGFPQQRTEVLASHQEEPIDLSIRKETRDSTGIHGPVSVGPMGLKNVPSFVNERNCYSVPSLKNDYQKDSQDDTNAELMNDGTSSTSEESFMKCKSWSDFNHNSIDATSIPLPRSLTRPDLNYTLQELQQQSVCLEPTENVHRPFVRKEGSTHVLDTDASCSTLPPSLRASPDASHLPLLVQMQAKACQATTFSKIFDDYEKIYGISADALKAYAITGTPLEIFHNISGPNNFFPMSNDETLHLKDTSGSCLNKEHESKAPENSIKGQMATKDEQKNTTENPLVECSVVVSQVCSSSGGQEEMERANPQKNNRLVDHLR
ncbi:uncharacterized protein LOC108664461 [Hyalella azteca]|uniref:Uncharacterized protein LOC108664461 n=1 Tax=Hyalella azteca TaxID=294128 RepID=A0A8B7MY97_HYAAZ|nr:uncharacterized protein LOC108664461 [Hyalella azteca]